MGVATRNGRGHMGGSGQWEGRGSGVGVAKGSGRSCSSGIGQWEGRSVGTGGATGGGGQWVGGATSMGVVMEMSEVGRWEWSYEVGVAKE